VATACASTAKQAGQ